MKHISAIEVGGVVFPTDDPVEAAKWNEKADRTVNKTKLLGGEILVSTVFLGINHGFFGRDLWYETMVFGESAGKFGIELDGLTRRYETRTEAQAGHEKVVQTVQGLIDALGGIESEMLRPSTDAIDPPAC